MADPVIEPVDTDKLLKQFKKAVEREFKRLSKKGVPTGVSAQRYVESAVTRVLEDPMFKASFEMMSLQEATAFFRDLSADTKKSGLTNPDKAVVGEGGTLVKVSQSDAFKEAVQSLGEKVIGEVKDRTIVTEAAKTVGSAAEKFQGVTVEQLQGGLPPLTERQQ